MKKTIDNVEYDTDNAELIANHDAADNKTAANLYRSKEGKYFLRIEKLQVRQLGFWRDKPMDGTAYPLPKGSVRFVEKIKPLSEEQAIDWVLATVVPECLGKVIQDRVGKLVSVDLGELAEPFARYCKDNNVTGRQVFDRALREWNCLSDAQKFSGIRDDRTLRDYTRPERCEVDETERAIGHL